MLSQILITVLFLVILLGALKDVFWVLGLVRYVFDSKESEFLYRFLAGGKAICFMIATFILIEIGPHGLLSIFNRLLGQ